MTERKAPRRLASCCLETWSWSHAMACPLSKSVSFHRVGIIRSSLTVAKCLLIKPQMWQKFTHWYSCCTVQLSVLSIGHQQQIQIEAFSGHFALVCHHTTHSEWKWYNSTTPTHCSTRIHSNFVLLENKTDLYALEMTTFSLILIPNVLCVVYLSSKHY